MGPLGDPRTLVDLAKRAEDAGWNGVFLWDHVLTEVPPIADTWTTLSAIAEATSSILIGPMVTPVPRRRPWIVARQAATAARLSAGRVVLGVGLGVDETGDLSSFGEEMNAAERRDMLEEGLDVIRAMWSGTALAHHGSYAVDLPAGPPEPYRPPIWMASSTGAPSVLARAVTCDGIFHNPPDRELPPEQVAELMTSLRKAGLVEDRPFDIVIRGNASAAWPEPKSVDLGALAEAGATWWMESLIHLDPLELSLEVVDAGPPYP